MKKWRRGHVRVIIAQQITHRFFVIWIWPLLLPLLLPLLRLLLLSLMLPLLASTLYRGFKCKSAALNNAYFASC